MYHSFCVGHSGCSYPDSRHCPHGCAYTTGYLELQLKLASGQTLYLTKNDNFFFIVIGLSWLSVESCLCICSGCDDCASIYCSTVQLL